VYGERRARGALEKEVLLGPLHDERGRLGNGPGVGGIAVVEAVGELLVRLYGQGIARPRRDRQSVHLAAKKRVPSAVATLQK